MQKYWNENLKVGIADLKNVYQFPQKVIMYPEVHQRKMYYCLVGSSKRISYARLKKGLVKKQISIEDDFPF